MKEIYMKLNEYLGYNIIDNKIYNQIIKEFDVKIQDLINNQIDIVAYWNIYLKINIDLDWIRVYETE